MKGALLLALGVFACCLLPLLLVAGGLVILSFLVQNETLVALVTVFVLALLFYAVYLRRKRNAGDTRADLIEVAES